jgi:hypothetical protein
MSKRLTNEIVDKRIAGRPIKRLGEYINKNKKIPFQCLIESCSNIWSPIVADVLYNDAGCPKCGGSKKLTNETVDARLYSLNIKRLSNYINNKTKTPLQCLKENCNHIWSPTISSVLNAGRGCPKCGGNTKLSNEIIDARLLETGRAIKRLGNYIGIDTKINFECLISECGFIWLATPYNVTGKKSTGCPKCSNRLPLTNEKIDDRLRDTNIKRIGDCQGTHTKIKFECLIDGCNFVWLAQPANILVKDYGTGCPNCTIHKNEKIVKKYLMSNMEIECQKDIRQIKDTESRKILVDFFIINSNTIVEYNGRQHYRPVCFGGISKKQAKENFIKQQARDIYLQSFCKQNNINLIWIDGREYTNTKLEKYLIETIIPQLQNNKI